MTQKQNNEMPEEIWAYFRSNQFANFSMGCTPLCPNNTEDRKSMTKYIRADLETLIDRDAVVSMLTNKDMEDAFREHEEEILREGRVDTAFEIGFKAAVKLIGDKSDE